MKYVIWDTMGNILHRCGDVEEFEMLMEEYDYTELSRTHNGREVNVAVQEYF